MGVILNHNSLRVRATAVDTFKDAVDRSLLPHCPCKAPSTLKVSAVCSRSMTLSGAFHPRDNFRPDHFARLSTNQYREVLQRHAAFTRELNDPAALPRHCIDKWLDGTDRCDLVRCIDDCK